MQQEDKISMKHKIKTFVSTKIISPVFLFLNINPSSISKNITQISAFLHKIKTSLLSKIITPTFNFFLEHKKYLFIAIPIFIGLGFLIIKGVININNDIERVKHPVYVTPEPKLKPKVTPIVTPEPKIKPRITLTPSTTPTPTPTSQYPTGLSATKVTAKYFTDKIINTKFPPSKYTITKKHESYYQSLKSARDHYYEWRIESRTKSKNPYYLIGVSDSEISYFAKDRLTVNGNAINYFENADYCYVSYMQSKAAVSIILYHSTACKENIISTYEYLSSE